MVVTDPFAIAADILDPQPHRYATDLVGWVHDRLGEHFWSKQREIADALVQHRRVAVKACHGPGKSFFAARTAAWWVDTTPVGDAIAVTTAPTHKQVHVVLWQELRTAHRKGELAGKVGLDDEWKTSDGTVLAIGRKPADHDEHGFQGIHRRRVLVILDEACGIPAQLWTAAEAITTNDDCRILAIGNPDDPASEFAKVCRPGSGWHVIEISAFDTPNLTGEAVPDGLRALLPSKQWVEDARVRWGESSPLYQSKVLGRFPENATDTVVPLAFAEACRNLENPLPDAEHVELGVDIAASEDGDETVIIERRGAKARIVDRMRTADANHITGRILQAIIDTGATVVKVDSNGVGWGVFWRLAELGDEGQHQAAVFGVNVGTASSDPTRFPKLRDELWWEIGRVLSQHRAWDLSELDDEGIAQLTAPKYSLDSSGRVKVEKKADTKKRLGGSPDIADALLLAFYTPTVLPEEGTYVVDDDDLVVSISPV